MARRESKESLSAATIESLSIKINAEWAEAH